MTAKDEGIWRDCLKCGRRFLSPHRNIWKCKKQGCKGETGIFEEHRFFKRNGLIYKIGSS
jgi:uncharacterized OB-fold protein